jgi:hypothetical protein
MIFIFYPDFYYLWWSDIFVLYLILAPTSLELQNDMNISFLIEYLTLYLCITFHFIAMVIYIIREKGVFYSYENILMLEKNISYPSAIIFSLSSR